MKNLRITDNDLKLFRYLFEQDFLTREQIKDYVWSDLSDSYVTHRLWRMNKAGYVKKHPDITAGTGTVIMAGKEAVNLIKNKRIKERMKNLSDKFNNSEEFISRYDERDKIVLAQFDHDRMVTEIRLMFEKENKLTNWTSQRMIWKHNSNCGEDKKFNIIADAIFQSKFNTSKGEKTFNFALELEHNLKKDVRYKDIFKRYSKEKRIDFVLYIATSNRIYKKLQEIFTEDFFDNIKTTTKENSLDIHNGFRKFYAARFDDLQQDKYLFYRQEGDRTIRF